MSALHQHAKDVFLAALARPAPERETFVAEACGTDRALGEEVRSLLAFHESEGGEDPLSPSGGEARAGEPFAPGDVLAGRYRMVTRIGRGGMGDVWRADDLVLETPVAIKLIHSTGAEGRERMLNEVRLARQITHPSVCRVFDVGEADGSIFLSMELVDGEDLATLLRRVGRLPPEKVVDIAQQLCAGLAAAHAQGVLHRDLKPANVLIDDHGRVRITDFGIAITTGSARRNSLTGTPGYMAPEQFEAGAPLSERTDIYALGLVLYQLIVGRHAFDGLGPSTRPPRPSSLVPDVSPQLEKVVLQALSRDPAQRPASALEMGAILYAPKADRREVSRPWLAGVAVVAVIGILAVLTSRLLPGGSTRLTGQDTIVLADFENSTSDPVFDGALKVALAVALEQSPFLKVFPDQRMEETLRLMGRPADGAVTKPVAREIAQREQLKALLSGSISGLGRNYVIALEAVNAATGDVMAREQVEATSKEDVLTALGGAASRLREKLGESLASIQKYDVPLARATTPSLEALHAYSLALDHGSVNPRLEAIPHLRRALDLDPDFALALALLSTVYVNNGQTSLAPEYSARAFALRDRVSERERFFITFRYYRDATQDWERALDLTRLWTATYPREGFAFNSLGTALSRFAQYEASIGAFRQAIALEPRLTAPYSNLAGVLMALNRFDDAKAVLQSAAAAGLDAFSIRRLSYLAAFLDGDTAGMERFVSASVGVGRTNAAYGWDAHSYAFRGQIAAAHDQFRRGIQMAQQGGFSEVAGQLGVEDAQVHALAGQCGIAVAETNEGLGHSRDNYSLERASRTLALCGAETEASALVSEITRRFAQASVTTRILVPVSNAAIALQRGQAARVLELLVPVAVYDHAQRAELWPAYLRGLAHLRLADGAAAAADFQSVVDHRGVSPNGPVYPMARLGLARALVMTDDTARARQEYDALLETWKDADGGLAPLAEARRERAALR